jgi:hypothetical protein
MGFKAGDTISIEGETNRIVGFGSIILEQPLLSNHAAGAAILRVSAGPPAGTVAGVATMPNVHVTMPNVQATMPNVQATPPSGPALAVIQLNKGQVGLGVNFHGAGNENDGTLAILVKGIHPDMAAGLDGRLQVGDRIMSVDGRSLVGKSSKEAVQLLSFTKDIVVFEIEATPERLRDLAAFEAKKGKVVGVSTPGKAKAAAKQPVKPTVLGKNIVLTRLDVATSFGFSVNTARDNSHVVSSVAAGGTAEKYGALGC